MSCIRSIFLLTIMILCFHAGVFSQKTSAPVLKGDILLDSKGDTVNAHGAGILFHKGRYYLYGEIKKGGTWLVPGQSWEDYRVSAEGVSCYVSKDLKH